MMRVATSNGGAESSNLAICASTPEHYDPIQARFQPGSCRLLQAEAGQQHDTVRYFDLTQGDAKIRSSSQDSTGTDLSTGFESCCAWEDVADSTDAIDSGSECSSDANKERDQTQLPSPILTESQTSRERQVRIHLGPRPQSPRPSRQLRIELGPRASTRRAPSPSEADAGVVALGIWKVEGQTVDRERTRALRSSPPQDESGAPGNMQSCSAQSCSDVSLKEQAKLHNGNDASHVNATSVDRLVFKMTSKLEQLDVVGLFSDCF